jgi:uncharacterized protein YcfL
MKCLHGVVLAAIVGSVAACSASNMARNEPVPSGESEKRRVLESNNTLLYNRLRIMETRTRKKNDLLQVQAKLRNQWKFELDFQYRIKWFDADGFEIEPEGQAWRQLVIPGSHETNVQGVAPNSKATSFEVWVRE